MALYKNSIARVMTGSPNGRRWKYPSRYQVFITIDLYLLIFILAAFGSSQREPICRYYVRRHHRDMTIS